MLHGFIAVKPVDMQEIDRTIVDTMQSLIKGAAQQCRERGITFVVEGAKILKDRVVLHRSVCIAQPSVYGKRASG